MAYNGNFVPATTIEEAQDGMGFKLNDTSTWDGQSGDTTICTVSIVHVDDNEDQVIYDDVELGGFGDEDYDDFLTSDGVIIDIADLTIDSEDAGDTFPDGYYEITVKYNDGSYSPGDEPYYKNTQAFLAKYRAMKRTMPALLLVWPITADVREKNYDIFALGLYLDAAEYAADLARKIHFRKFISVIRQVLDFYSIPEPF
jgi:hypothetical protein